MTHLIQRGLMLGNLIEVSSPALVERSNRALRRLIWRVSKLYDFHIDLPGSRPGIGSR
jgi:hypothetical protein